MHNDVGTVGVVDGADDVGPTVPDGTAVGGAAVDSSTNFVGDVVGFKVGIYVGCTVGIGAWVGDSVGCSVGVGVGVGGGGSSGGVGDGVGGCVGISVGHSSTLQATMVSWGAAEHIEKLIFSPRLEHVNSRVEIPPPHATEQGCHGP